MSAILKTAMAEPTIIIIRSTVSSEGRQNRKIQIDRGIMAAVLGPT